MFLGRSQAIVVLKSNKVSKILNLPLVVQLNYHVMLNLKMLNKQLLSFRQFK